MPKMIVVEEEEEETLFDPKCTIHHISDAILDIKQYTHIFTYIMHIHAQTTCTYTYAIKNIEKEDVKRHII